MPPAQHGVTEEPDGEENWPEEGQEDESGEKEAKGFLGFLKRRDPGERRSETEWVDTLRAQEEPDEEPVSDLSPFQAGVEPEPEPQPEPEPPAILPEPEDEYVTERLWRRRHHDELDRIHNYIDRIIGTDHDPVMRHRKLSGLGVARHSAPRRDLATVDVEGLDQELMIAFTFPKEELRSARVVYETEGGYVIEVTRAVGGDETRTERQYYTVSRVGSVAHTLDKLRAREIERRVQAQEGPRPVPAPRSREPIGEPARHEPEPLSEEPEPAPEPEPTGLYEVPESAPETQAPPEPQEEPAGSDQAAWQQRSEAATEPSAVIAPRADEEPVAPQEPEADEPKEKRGGFTRFLRKDKQEPATAEPEDETPAGPEPEGESAEKQSRFGALSARFRRKDKSEGDASEDAEPESR